MGAFFSWVLLPLTTAFMGGAFAYLSYWFVPERYMFPIEPLKVDEPVIEEVQEEDTFHLPTPEPLRGIYMTACVAATKDWRERMVQFADDTEINAIIIDVKDYTGTVSIPADENDIEGVLGKGCKIPDIKEFIEMLHDRGIYAIARIAVFQDPFYAVRHPDLAVKKKSDTSVVWKDRKGLSFIDAGAKPFWDYIVQIGEVSYEAGFDELNLDYIRFPSDGDMTDIYFPWSNATVTADRLEGKAKVVRSFFEYMREAFPEGSTTSPKLSADLFGMTTTNRDDLGIGQILEYAIPNFDYIAPMVYPSHYPSGFQGYENVNKYPYEIVKYSMDVAVGRLVQASTTPLKLRPWLQDNDYPVPYTADMVRAQIDATYDAGLDSWMLWDPGNTYTREALLGPEAEKKNQAL